jgi:hypothetical protein
MKKKNYIIPDSVMIKSYPLLLTVQSRQDSAVMVETLCGKKRETMVYSGLSILAPTFNTSKPQSSHRNSQMYVLYKRIQHFKKFAGSDSIFFVVLAIWCALGLKFCKFCMSFFATFPTNSIFFVMLACLQTVGNC